MNIDTVKRFLNKKTMTYIAVGLASLLTELLSFFVLFSFFGNIIVAQTISYLLSLVVNFSGSRVFTFGAHKNGKVFVLSTKKQTIAYGVLASCNLVLGNLLIYFFHDVMELPSIYAKLLVVGCTIVWNFVIFDKLIFKSK